MSRFVIGARLGVEGRSRCDFRDVFVIVIGHVLGPAHFLVFSEIGSSKADNIALVALPLRPHDADLLFLIFVMLSFSVVHENVVRGKVFLADVALVGLGDLALFFLGLFFLYFPFSWVLVSHVLIEVLAIHERRGAVSTFIHDRLWLIFEQELFVLLSLDVCLLRLALADDLVVLKSEIQYLF